jgi:hypothetical protein
MASLRKEMDAAELLDRTRALGEAFRPAAPMARRDLFAGRSRQLGELFAVVSQPGQHAVVYGERGVGKTSLAAVTAEMLRTTGVASARATCDSSDDFGSAWRKALGDLEITVARRPVGFSPAAREDAHSAARLLGTGPVTPNDVRRALQRLTDESEVVVFLDEFDRLVKPEVRALFADMIKTLSDQLVRATLVLVGVGDDVAELIREHRSVERALVQVQMPRMTREELAQIVTSGMAVAGMTTTNGTVDRIAMLSQGLPHYTHLLAQLAAQNALADGRTDVGLRDVQVAVERAIERAQQSVAEAYSRATAGSGRSLRPQVVLAAALAQSDELGFFGAADVRPPLERLTRRTVETSAFSQHLDGLAGDVLQKRGEPRRYRYRFENPLLQPYVVMKGVADGLVRARDLR